MTTATSTVLVRVRFTREMVAHLDDMVRHVSEQLRRDVPRAAVIRTIVTLTADELTLLDVQGLTKLFCLDTVRRGPLIGRPRKRRAA